MTQVALALAARLRDHADACHSTTAALLHDAADALESLQPVPEAAAPDGLLRSLQTTPAMRARQRELSMNAAMDDYDRVTIMLLDDLATCLAYIAPLEDFCRRHQPGGS